MFQDKLFFVISENYINEYCIKREKSNIPFIMGRKSGIEIRKYHLGEVSNLTSNLRKKNIYILYSGEEFFIKNIKIPIVRQSILGNIVKNELNYLFSDSDGLSYDYDILRKSKKDIDLLAYCINTSKNILLHNFVKDVKINGVYLVQLAIVKAASNMIKKDNMIVISILENYLYMIAIIKGKIIANILNKDFNGSETEFMSDINYILEKYGHMEKYLNEKHNFIMCFVNFEFKSIIKCMYDSYDCVDLGKIKMENIICYL